MTDHSTTTSSRGGAQSREPEGRQHPLLLLALLAMCIIPFLGLADFSTRGEGREALVVRSILSAGDWVLPRGYGDVVPSKPPLLHWLGAAASTLFGEANEFTLRLPSALSGLLTTLFFVLVLRRYENARTSALFVLMLTASFEWFRALIAVRVDMVHAATLSSGLLAAFLALEKSRCSWWLASTLLLAGAVLSKGPVGLVLPATILGAWILCERTLRTRRNIVRVTNMLLLSGILAGLWYVAASEQAPREFADKVWFENIDRFAGNASVDLPHEHSILYFVGLLLVGTLPWSPLALAALRKFRRTEPRPLRVIWGTSPSIFRFFALSAGSVFLFYCIPEGKRSVYLLAAYPFMAALAAILIERTATYRSLTVGVTGGFFAVSWLAYAVVLPFFVIPASSERIVSEAVQRTFGGPRKIYSFAYEFYGTAFYSGYPFERLEVALERGEPLHEHTPVVAFGDKLPGLKEALQPLALDVREVSSITLKRRPLLLLEITKGHEPPL